MNDESIEVHNMMAKKIIERDLEISKLKFELATKTNEVEWKQKEIDQLTKSHHDENLNSLILAIVGVSCMMLSIRDANLLCFVASVGFALIGTVRIVESIKSGR